MKERPILMQGEMVRAVLEGRKRQTRRVIRPQPDDSIDRLHGNQFRNRAPYVLGHPETGEGDYGFGFADEHNRWNCPYGRPGDRLWVRENWSPDALTMYPCPNVWYAATDDLRSDGVHSCPKESRGRYADCLACWEGNNQKFRWRPSIHMPRHLSRITLEIVAVRVEPVQLITLGEICKEGLARSVYDFKPATSGFGAWIELWDRINGAGAWEKNEWVWVVEFERV